MKVDQGGWGLRYEITGACGGNTTMKAWTFQIKRDVEKHGTDAAPWHVGWVDPATGKRRSKSCGTKTAARDYARALEGQAAAGIYRTADHSKTTWADFRERYDATVIDMKREADRRGAEGALAIFERIAKPQFMRGVNAEMIDLFIVKRSRETARASNGMETTGNRVSPATVNRELRYIRAALKRAHEWKLLSEVPKIKMIKEPDRLPRFITEDDFAKIYDVCDTARRPFEECQEYTPGAWWRAFLVFLYCSGWRLSETLALQWDDVSLDKATATTRAEVNKGRRDEIVPLHPLAVEHLRKIVSFEGPVFPWPHSDRAVWQEFAKIQETAGIRVPCTLSHEHTPHCFRYGFHDFRRSYGTRNARILPAVDLQKLMRHRSFATTLRYINAAHGLETSVQKIDVPAFLAPPDRDAGSAL